MTSCGSPAGATCQVEVAADFDISVEPVRRWVRQATSTVSSTGGTTAAQSELLQLRRENRRLETENEIFRRTPAHFAKASHNDDLPAAA